MIVNALTIIIPYYFIHILCKPAIIYYDGHYGFLP